MKLGAIVILRSGGPAMTITSWQPGADFVDCSWFDAAGNVQSNSFDTASLVVVQEPEAVDAHA